MGGGQRRDQASTRFDHTPAKTARARRLRKDATSPERILWSKLKGAQIDGASFRRQHPLGPYVIDFYCPSLGIVVELDGEHHGYQANAARDRQRDAWLVARGLRVLRFWNENVRTNLTGVVEDIFFAVSSARGSDPLPASPFQGEGKPAAPAEESRRGGENLDVTPAPLPPERGRMGGGRGRNEP
jgi:very-short-patch-repair endonuclease